MNNNNNEDKQKIEEQAKPVSHTEIKNQKYYNPQANGTFPFNQSNIPNNLPPQVYMQFMEQQRPFILHPIHYGYPPYIPQTTYLILKEIFNLLIIKVDLMNISEIEEDIRDLVIKIIHTLEKIALAQNLCYLQKIMLLKRLILRQIMNQYIFTL